MSRRSSRSSTAAAAAAAAANAVSSSSSSSSRRRPYDDVMGINEDDDNDRNSSSSSSGPVTSLSSRLAALRAWLADPVSGAGGTVHPSLCVVNGEATDGTRHAPVLTFAAAASDAAGADGVDGSSPTQGRCGAVDRPADRALYDRTVGCCVRAARELRRGETAFSIPRRAFATPDVVARSDAGRVAAACAEREDGASYWDAFRHTGACVRSATNHVSMANAILVNVLRERKRADSAMEKALKESEGRAAAAENGNGGEGGGSSKAPPYRLAPAGKISTRAAFLLFLIHQRFSDGDAPPVRTSYPVGGRAPDDDVDEDDEEALPADFSFAPYARTLPSFVPLPLCWRRNELALLSACMSGLSTLQEVAAHTSLLSSDFCALLEAGILHRFPDVFPRHLLTWDRWVWAAAAHMSRNFPASLWLREGEGDRASEAIPGFDASSAAVWNDLGVLVPLLDMLNHEEESSQIRWDRASASTNDENEMDDEDDAERVVHPRVVLEKRVKKGGQLYNNYSGAGSSNQDLISQYGFALMSNENDTVTIGLGFTDAVGRLAETPPADYDEEEVVASVTANDADEKTTKPKKKKNAAAADEDEDVDANTADDPDSAPDADAPYLVFDSPDVSAVNAWWDQERLGLLERLPNYTQSLLSTLRSGKKLSLTARNDGTFDNVLLATAVVATMARGEVRKNVRAERPVVADDGTLPLLPLTRRHRRVLRRFLLYFFVRKLERLLANLNDGLKDHFDLVRLWDKATKGGLDYEDEDHHGDGTVGWRTLFDRHAYRSCVAVERRYCAVGPDSCVLTLYDGHLRAIRTSLRGVATEEEYEKRVTPQLEALGFVLGEEEGEEETMEEENGGESADAGKEAANDDAAATATTAANGDTTKNGEHDDKRNSPSAAPQCSKNRPDSASNKHNHHKNQTPHSSSNSNSIHYHTRVNNVAPNARRAHDHRRNGGKGGGRDPPRPPAIKLHIGNLSYNTSPSELFDFFGKIYGRDNVLECHIPTERDTHRSRGFGFVTMPERVANQALNSGRTHEIEGRVLKVAPSNTAGSNNNNQNQNYNGKQPTRLHPPLNQGGERCPKCGYRPRYCDCGGPAGGGGPQQQQQQQQQQQHPYHPHHSHHHPPHHPGSHHPQQQPHHHPPQQQQPLPPPSYPPPPPDGRGGPPPPMDWRPMGGGGGGGGGGDPWGGGGGGANHPRGGGGGGGGGGGWGGHHGHGGGGGGGAVDHRGDDRHHDRGRRDRDRDRSGSPSSSRRRTRHSSSNSRRSRDRSRDRRSRGGREHRRSRSRSRSPRRRDRRDDHRHHHRDRRHGSRRRSSSSRYYDRSRSRSRDRSRSYGRRGDEDHDDGANGDDDDDDHRDRRANDDDDHAASHDHDRGDGNNGNDDDDDDVAGGGKKESGRRDRDRSRDRDRGRRSSSGRKRKSSGSSSGGGKRYRRSRSRDRDRSRTRSRTRSRSRSRNDGGDDRSVDRSRSWSKG